MLPERTHRLAAVLLLHGFPIAIGATWAFEATSEGLERHEAADPEELRQIVQAPASRRWPAGLPAILIRGAAGSVAAVPPHRLGRLTLRGPLIESIPPPNRPHPDPIASDPVLGPLIEEHGLLEAEVADDPFRRLVLAIVNQQLSTASAAAIRRRLVERFELRPDVLLAAEPKALTAVGLSRRKAEYVQGIAAAFQEDGLTRAAFDAMADEEVVERLVRIRGVGTWTAKIFLMFALGRRDVFPVEDLGIRRGMTNLFGDLNTDEMLEVAERWRPERTRACLYVWRAADVARAP